MLLRPGSRRDRARRPRRGRLGRCRASVIAGGDSHTCTHGALGAFGTGLGSTDIAACLAYGPFWQAVPGTIQVELHGRLGPFTSGKDVILAVIDEIGVAGGNEHVLEFVGEGAAALTIDERLAVANMAVEAGSENGLLPRRRDDAALPRRARTDRPWTAASPPTATPSSPDALRIDLDRLRAARRDAVLARATSSRSTEVIGTHGRPGLHRELLERHDDRSPPGREHAPGPEGASADAGDRRPRDAADLSRRRSRRGCSTCSSRPARWSRPPPAARASAARTAILADGESRGHDDEPQLPRPDGRRATSGVYLANSYVAARPRRSRARSSIRPSL